MHPKATDQLKLLKDIKQGNCVLIYQRISMNEVSTSTIEKNSVLTFLFINFNVQAMYFINGDVLDLKAMQLLEGYFCM